MERCDGNSRQYGLLPPNPRKATNPKASVAYKTGTDQARSKIGQDPMQTGEENDFHEVATKNRMVATKHRTISLRIGPDRSDNTHRRGVSFVIRPLA
jgi:hypothetical protein